MPPDVYEAARLDRAGAWQRFVHITLPLIRPAIVMVVILRMMTALSAFAAIFAATGGGPGSATEILNLYAYRTSFTELNLGYGASLAMVLLVDHARDVVLHVQAAEEAHDDARGPLRQHRCSCASPAGGLAVWVFPVLWGLLTSFKTERDVLAYPPKFIFEPTLDNYREVHLRRLVDRAEPVVEHGRGSTASTLLTMLFAVPAAYALARLRYPGQARLGLLCAGHADAAAGRA